MHPSTQFEFQLASTSIGYQGAVKYRHWLRLLRVSSPVFVAASSMVNLSVLTTKSQKVVQISSRNDGE